MKYYTTKSVDTFKEVITLVKVLEEKKVEVSFKEFRKLIIWNDTKILPDICDTHLHNILYYLKTMNKSNISVLNTKYQHFNILDAIDIIQEEMKYRKLYISYKEYKKIYLKN